MEFVHNLIAERSVIREALKGIIWTIFFNRLFGPIIPNTNEFLNITYPIATNLPDLDSLIDERINQLVKSTFDKKLPARGRINIQFLDKEKSIKKSGWFSKSDNQILEILKPWESWILNIECLPIDEVQSGDSTRTQTMAVGASANVSASATVPASASATVPTTATATASRGTTPPPSELPPHHRENKYSNNILKSIKSFELNIVKIIDTVDKHKLHIPPITSLESSPFPYKILILPIPPEEPMPISETTSSSSSNPKSDTTDEGWGNYIKKIL